MSTGIGMIFGRLLMTIVLALIGHSRITDPIVLVMGVVLVAMTDMVGLRRRRAP